MKIRTCLVLTFICAVFSVTSFATVGSGDYVRRGLVAQWDALENAGVGVHDDAATTWKDLSGNGFDWAMASADNYRWSARGLEMLGKGGVATLANHDKTNFYGKIVTVECVYAHNKSSKYGYILDTGYGVASKDSSHMSILMWNSAQGREQFVVWAPLTTNTVTRRYGFTSTIGVTNTFAVVYKCTGETPATGVKSLSKNGVACASDYITDWWRPTTTVFKLGSRTNSSTGADEVPANGTLLALRFYASELTQEELALNAALDEVRLFGKNPADVTPPPGWRFDANGDLERVAYVWTGSADSSDWSDAGNWQLDDGRAATRAPGLDGDKVEIGSGAVSVDVGCTGELTSLALGTGATLTLAAGTEVRTRAMTCVGAKVGYGLYGASSAAWAAGAGKVRVGDLAAQSAQYVKDGLVAHWDALDRSGTGAWDTRHREVWKDLSGNGLDWTLLTSYKWEEKSFYFRGSAIAGMMPNIDQTYFKGKISTIELVWQSEDARESIIFNPAAGYTALVFTLKTNSFDSSVYQLPKQLGDWIGFTDFKKINFGTDMTLGATNTYSATYQRSGNYPTAGMSLYRNGTVAELVDGKNFFGSDADICLGGRNSKLYSKMPPKGHLMALRIYDRVLTQKEILCNQALDRVRYLGADPATVLPACRKFDADGKIIKTGLFLLVR